MNQEQAKDRKSIEMSKGFLKRSWNKSNEAEEHLKKRNYPESISASQECIEISVKAVFLLLTKNYPKKHEFTEEEFEMVLSKIPEKLRHLDFLKVYLYSKFWSNFYTVAKYGLSHIGVGPEKLFDKEEAELALGHADKCRRVASQLENYIEHPW